MATPIPTVVGATPPPTIQDVYSGDNIQQASTAPAPAPNLQDPYGLYDQFMGSQELKDARANVLATQGMINTSKQALRTTTEALNNQNEQAMGGTGASINLIGKQVGRARNLTSNELAGLGETLQGQQALLGSLESDAQNRYNIALREREQLNDLIRQTGGQAGITYTDSYEGAIKKAQAWEREELKRKEKEAEKRAKKERKRQERAELKKMLRAIGKKTSGSKREMRRRLRKYYKKQGAYEDKMKDLDYRIKLKAFNKPYYKPTSGGGNDKLQEGYAGIKNFFERNKGNDGKVSPSAYRKAKTQWLLNKLPASSFDQMFSTWQNPNDYYN